MGYHVHVVSFLFIVKVINVRNKVMHSPDFRFSKQDMDESLQRVQELAKSLEKYAPGLKTISEEIQKVPAIDDLT